jgi:methionyl-tRNA formyltransferase
MRAIIVGAVESTRVALEAVAGAKGWTVPAVITLPPALAARHSDFIDLAPLAGETGARIIHAANSNAPEVVDAVAAYAPDFVFVIGWSQICGPAFRAAQAGRAAVDDSARREDYRRKPLLARRRCRQRTDSRAKFLSRRTG